MYDGANITIDYVEKKNSFEKNAFKDLYAFSIEIINFFKFMINLYFSVMHKYILLLFQNNFLTTYFYLLSKINEKQISVVHKSRIFN